jgi:hypothetical protein
MSRFSKQEQSKTGQGLATRLRLHLHPARLARASRLGVAPNHSRKLTLDVGSARAFTAADVAGERVILRTREQLTGDPGPPDPGTHEWAIEYDGECIGSARLVVDPDQHRATYAVGAFVARRRLALPAASQPDGAAPARDRVGTGTGPVGAGTFEYGVRRSGRLRVASRPPLLVLQEQGRARFFSLNGRFGSGQRTTFSTITALAGRPGSRRCRTGKRREGYSRWPPTRCPGCRRRRSLRFHWG